MNRFLGLTLTIGLLAPVAVFAKPAISPVSPITAAAGVPINLTATVGSTSGIQRCSLWVDLAEIGEMTVSGGIASRSYTFPSGGSRIAFVFCRELNGEMNAGATTAINVTGAIQVSPPLSTPTPILTPPILTPTPTPILTPPVIPTPAIPQETQIFTTISPDAGKILKAICPQSAATDHPCRAVYYISADGKRHAFPNSRVFFTWYGGFDSVQGIPLETLSQYPLGVNVVYRAGVRMVKFTTDPKVYVVSRGGLLRWVKTEELARGFYGNDWNKKIDDIADVFYTNYNFGTEINSLTEYSPSTELEHSAE